MANATQKDSESGEIPTHDYHDDPAVLEYLKSNESMGNPSKEFFSKNHLLVTHFLPPTVKRRTRALKNLQLSVKYLEASFYNEVHELEMKMQKSFKEIFDLRYKILQGEYEPRDEELYPENNCSTEISPELEVKMQIDPEQMEDGPGIPNFWLTVFRNVSVINDMIYDYDVEILKHLVDVRVKLKNEPMGFKLEFVFEPNEYFTNTILSKEYEMDCIPDKTDPFSFDGPEIKKSIGCIIDWKPEKNVTIKSLKKKPLQKTRRFIRAAAFKSVKNDSFFNFFSPPAMSDDPSTPLNEELENEITKDFEIGHYLRERIIPHAVLYYTGEAADEEEESSEEDEGDDYTEEGDEEGGKSGKDESEESSAESAG